MDTGTGQDRADVHLSIGDVQMEVVPAPVLLVPLAVLLGADVSLLGQIGQHGGQGLMRLPLDAFAPVAGRGLGKGSPGRLDFLLALAARFLARLRSMTGSGIRSGAEMAVASRAMWPMRSRVIGKLRTALAIKAVARAARSLAGRPVRARLAANQRARGTKEMTAASNSNCGLGRHFKYQKYTRG